ncbi:unnamed protein product [Effrenium voratum]|uniref:Glycosyltransferase 2-like domain-containing protein n=1 Tax=Effrenium voratum TaxID=2562239 RepID=A0AA36IBZ4_9DINO|nr:unnamed protein product [Effrenium voratum]
MLKYPAPADFVCQLAPPRPAFACPAAYAEGAFACPAAYAEGAQSSDLLANSGDDIARPPSWKTTLKGAAFWANPNHWDKVPKSFYWTLTFMFFKVVGTIGGYRGRAAFARKSALKRLMKRREEAMAVVDFATQVHLEMFPQVADRLRQSTGKQATAVVLPTLVRTPQDVKELKATLSALASQTQPPDAVILVDDFSPQNLQEKELWQGPGLALVRLHQNVGPAGARTVGLRLLRQWARGRDVVVCLTDSDAAPDKNWIEQMQLAQQRRPGIVCGPTLSVDKSHTGRFHDHFGNLNGRWSWEDPAGVLMYGCTCNFSVDLNSIGDAEFDPIFSRPGFEDIEFCWRLRVEKNVLTRYCEDARMYHQYDRGPIGLYRQFWKYGNTEPIMAWMHPDFSFQGSRPVTQGFTDPRDAEKRGFDSLAESAVRGLDGVVRFLKWQTKQPPGRSRDTIVPVAPRGELLTDAALDAMDCAEHAKSAAASLRGGGWGRRVGA